MEQNKLRYAETGPLHRDFHRSTNGTISYLRRRYGIPFLDKVLHRTAQDVYRAIHDDLKAGNTAHLVAHWQHFMAREGGRFTISEDADAIVMEVEECPAIAYLKAQGHEIDPAFCRQTIVMNTALAEETPFEITTEVLGAGRCRQTIRRRN